MAKDEDRKKKKKKKEKKHKKEKKRKHAAADDDDRKKKRKVGRYRKVGRCMMMTVICIYSMRCCVSGIQVYVL